MEKISYKIDVFEKTIPGGMVMTEREYGKIVKNADKLLNVNPLGRRKR